MDGEWSLSERLKGGNEELWEGDDGNSNSDALKFNLTIPFSTYAHQAGTSSIRVHTMALHGRLRFPILVASTTKARQQAQWILVQSAVLQLCDADSTVLSDHQSPVMSLGSWQ